MRNVAAFVGVGVMLLAQGAKAESVALEGATEVAIFNAGGDVLVRARRGDGLVLEQKKTLGAATCLARAAHQGQTLEIRVSDPNGRACAVDLSLSVPPRLGLRIEQGNGNTMVSGTRGPFALQLGEGNAVVGGTFDALDVTIGTGSLSLQGLAGNGRLQVGHGNVQIFFASKAKSNLTLDVASGNVTLFSDRPIAAQVRSSDGSVPASPWQSNAAAAINVTGTLGHGRLALRNSNR